MSYLHISFLFTFMSIVSEAVLRDGLRIESHKSGFSVSILTPCTMLCLVAQSCQTLGPHGLWPTRSLCPWDSSGENTGVSCYALLQGIFPTQGSNPGLPHCGWILYQLSHEGSPRILDWLAYPFSRGSSRPRNRTGVSCTAGGFFTN